MNAVQLKKLLVKTSKMPLEDLGSLEIQKLSLVLTNIQDKIERIEILKKIEELHYRVSIEDIPFYKFYLSQWTIQKPEKDAPLILWQQYLEQLTAEYKTIRKKRTAYGRILARIDRASEKTAMKIIMDLSAEEKKMISLLANLTIKTKRGVSKLNLAKSQSANLTWYRELKNTKQLGVLSKE